MNEETPLESRTRALGPAYDLIAAYGSSFGCFMESSGLGVAGRGCATRIVVPAGADQVARAAGAVAAALTTIARTGGDPAPFAFGGLPFVPGEDAVFVVPDRAVRRTSSGETWEIGVGMPGALEVVPGDLPLGPSLPHDVFKDVQLRPEPSTEGYTAAVASAIRRIGEGELLKVVLARTLQVRAGRQLDPKRLLWRLRAVDPECHAFALAMPGGGALVGASPELLVSRHGSEVRANPLAGSAPRSGDPLEDRANADGLLDSSKDRVEHDIVVESVNDALQPFCDSLTFDREPVLLGTANVWHLSTRFRGRLRVPAPNALELVAALHPTPAVGGAPRDLALETIAELEPFDRGLYAGPVGWMDANGDGQWAIALRCAELKGPEARLFAGAGIVDGSDPQQELDETERKFRAFLDSLRWGLV